MHRQMKQAFCKHLGSWLYLFSLLFSLIPLQCLLVRAWISSADCVDRMKVFWRFTAMDSGYQYYRVAVLAMSVIVSLNVHNCHCAHYWLVIRSVRMIHARNCDMLSEYAVSPEHSS